jgi:diadenosine tetraphosphate (Ap4A) HIT family hydrolase
MFEIDPAFAPGSQALGELALSHARLQTDARWPWIVLIPRVERARELEDLTADQRTLLMEEVVAAGRAVRAVGLAVDVAVEKLNVGALGNVTPQLHVHVVGRRTGDPAWPGPVWGVGTARAYAPEQLAAALAAAKGALRLP